MGEILSFGSSSKFKTDLGGNMRIIIVGGIAAGMSAAAKLRRTDRGAEIVVYEKSPHISFGACGLPYYVGGNFDNIDRMLVRTPEKVRETGIDVKVEHEVLSLDVQNKTIKVKDLQSGEIFSDKYDKLMIATGAATIIPPIENIETAYTLRSVEDGEKLKGGVHMRVYTVFCSGEAAALNDVDVNAVKKIGVKLKMTHAQRVNSDYKLERKVNRITAISAIQDAEEVDTIVNQLLKVGDDSLTA